MSVDNKSKARVFSIFNIIERGGLRDCRLDTRKIVGTDVWEIRIIQKKSIRLIYAVEKQQRVIILHGFYKKTQKTPLKHVRIALERFDEWNR